MKHASNQNLQAAAISLWRHSSNVAILEQGHRMGFESHSGLIGAQDPPAEALYSCNSTPVLLKEIMPRAAQPLHPILGQSHRELLPKWRRMRIQPGFI